MRVKPKDGKLYAEVTLRDVVERSDVSDLPMLSEIKRLYDENDTLRELVPKMARALGVGTDWCYSTCSHEFMCDPLKECPIMKAMRELGIEVGE